ncbi:IclR family transcriptional regulator [uncultured Desulfosarcina sp.]|uniref:IclR family transcriptional regulator n=1 Tax=uncultured Desulfosarcina sp. TaxID=218289 RepID=UPI0029C73262|nr:IclR family transcriptional regulator [uncultured Desulfosarcina sp.]
MSSKGEKYYFVASLAKGLRTLEVLAENGEMSASKMAAHLNTSRAASHRFLTTLRDLGYAEKTDEGRFRLSFKVLELGMKKLEGFEIRHTVYPFMQEIAMAFGETVNLGHWDGNAIVHLDKVNSKEILRLDVGMGAAAPAYCTGLGKAVLAFLSDNELNAYLESVSLTAMSPKTIVSVDRLKEEIGRIRRLGYAVDDEELSLGLRCVAAPIFDYTGCPNYALSISGPAQRMTKEKIDAIQAKLVPICRQISRQIGAPQQSDPNTG